MWQKLEDFLRASKTEGIAFQLSFFPVISVLHTMFFNWERNIWWSEGDLLSALALGALHTIMFLGFLLVLSFGRKALVFGISLAVLVSSSASYFISTFQLKTFGPNTMALVAETNLEEASGFISQELLFKEALAVGLSIFAARVAARAIKGFPLRQRVKVVAAIGVISAIVHMAAKEKLPLGLPFDVVKATLVYLEERNKMMSLIRERQNMTAPSAHFEGDEMIVVLILGEAARADHLGINGYSRPTTPVLAQAGVISFKQVRSCGTLTGISVPCMLTSATLEDPKEALRKPSLINVFRSAGFPTAWISNQRLLGKNDTPVSALAKEADFVRYNHPESHNLFSRVVDGELIPLMEEFLLSNPLKAFIVLHSIGSHWRYENHYPEEFRIFEPTCTSRSPRACKPEEVVNSYDNTIAYTDHFIYQVLERVKGKKALVWYVSDHGESLGEGGRWGHGQAEDIEEQRRVPMVVWASESFKEAYPEKWESLLSKENDPLSHDHLFHSLIQCAGVKNIELLEEMSLCSSGRRR